MVIDQEVLLPLELPVDQGHEFGGHDVRDLPISTEHLVVIVLNELALLVDTSLASPLGR